MSSSATWPSLIASSYSMFFTMIIVIIMNIVIIMILISIIDIHDNYKCLIDAANYVNDLQEVLIRIQSIAAPHSDHHHHHRKKRTPQKGIIMENP